MYREDDFIQLSALQHFVFCPRQCALSYIEQIWSENMLTAEGGIMHENVHKEQFEIRDGAKIERGMPLRSAKLGLSGKADVVEFRRSREGKWIPSPIEYKHGRPKENNCDKIQLCAQAICLEEMMGVSIPVGAVFYGKTRHRMDVLFNETLRRETETLANELHLFIKEGKTPEPVYSKKCESCSLIDMCMPKALEKSRDISDYIKESLEDEEAS